MDYWSNYVEVAEIRKKTAQAVITQLKEPFAPHGISTVLITDNTPEFLNEEVRKFAKEWKFGHRTMIKPTISSIQWQSRKCRENL